MTQSRYTSTIEKRGVAVAMVLLAVTFGLGYVIFCIAVFYDAVVNESSAGISENATQILTGWGGGIVGVLGAFVGYRAGTGHPETTTTDETYVDTDDELYPPSDLSPHAQSNVG